MQSERGWDEKMIHHIGLEAKREEETEEGRAFTDNCNRRQRERENETLPSSIFLSILIPLFLLEPSGIDFVMQRRWAALGLIPVQP